MRSDLAHIHAWIFDLDNTLYPASCDLFGLIDKRMTAAVARRLDLPLEEAFKVQSMVSIRTNSSPRSMRSRWMRCRKTGG
jgi:FMN phosphatase YigB (HAD superfamily)